MSVKELNLSSSDDDGVEGTEMKLDEKATTSVSSNGRETWTNERINPIHIPIVCRVPQRIVIMMRSIERLIIESGMGTLEFGAFLHGDFAEDGKLVVNEEFFIPKQKVTGASIDFEEDPPDPKFNGVIHRHPNSCTNFSGTDASYINKNFDFSLLYVNNDILLGIFNLDHNHVRIQLPINIQVMYPIFNLNEEEIKTKIQKHECLMKSSTHGNPDFGDNTDIRRFLRGREEIIDDANDAGEVRDDGSEIPVDEEDEDDAKLYQCKKCGEIQFIEDDDFPHDCESCDELLNREDVEEIHDLSEVQDEDQKQAVQLMLMDRGVT
jgi:hypothetical protein